MADMIEILRRAREKIASPEHWTTDSYAKAADGVSVGTRSPLAVCWCALGAISAVVGSFQERIGAEEALEDAIVSIAPEIKRVADFNDHYGHAAVLRAFDLAISQVEAA